MNVDQLLKQAEAAGAPAHLLEAVKAEQWQQEMPEVPVNEQNEAVVNETIGLLQRAEEAGAPKELLDAVREEQLGGYRAQLESQLDVDLAKANDAERALEGAEDSVLENAYEGVGQMAAGANELALDIGNLLTSPVRYAYREATGNEIKLNDLLGDYDPAESQFVEEPLVRESLRAVGQLVGSGAGLTSVARDSAKVSSTFYDIMGLGYTEASTLPALTPASRLATDIRTGKVNAPDITTDEGVLEVMNNISKEIEVGANKTSFDAFEQTTAETAKWQKSVAKLQDKWTKAVANLDEVNANGGNVEAAEAKVAEVIDEMTVLKAEDPRLVGPKLNKGGLQRYNEKRTAVLNDLEEMGVSRTYANEMILKYGLFKPKGLQELIDFDATVMNKYYDGSGTGFTKAAAIFRPASGLMRSKVGAVPAALAERAFETTARAQELFTIKYARNEEALTELSGWAELPEIKSLFLDLRLNAANMTAIMESAKENLSPASKELFDELVKDSRKHQAEMKIVFKDDVTMDEIFWASQKKKAAEAAGESDQYVAGSATARSSIEQVRTSDTVTGSLERSRKPASMMAQSELDEYANPILEQIKRLNQEQAYKNITKNFGMRQSIGLGDDSKQFFQVFEDTIGRQSGSAKMAKTAREIVEGVYVGTTKRPPIFVEGFMKQALSGTLGQFDSALLNLHDVFVSMLKSGVKPTMKAMLKKEGMDIRDFGIGGDVKSLGEFQQAFENTLERGTIMRGLDWYQEKSFKYSGFRMMDRAGKGVIMRAAVNKARAAAKSGRLYDEFGYMMSNRELGKIQKQLADDVPISNMTPEARKLTEELMFARLGEQQLISAMGRPLEYMRHPGFRWAYTLSGFAIKQSEMMKVGIYDALRKGEYAKAGEFMAGYMIFAAGGYALINNLRGLGQWYLGNESKEPTPERFIANLVEQPIAAVTMNRLGNPYSNQQFMNDPVSFLGESLVPPAGFIGNAAKDTTRVLAGKDPEFYTLNSVPYGDELRAWLTN